MKVFPFILAAGDSSRMAPYNQVMDKSLMPDIQNGKSSSRIIVERLSVYPDPILDDITICVLDKHRAAFEWEFRDLKGVVRFHNTERPLGTAGHIMVATKDLQVPDDAIILVHYADNITEIDYRDFIDAFTSLPEEFKAAIAITKKARIPYSQVRTFYYGKKNGKNIEVVDHFEEKPYVQEPTWTGIALFKMGYLRKFIHEKEDVHFELDFGKHIIPVMSEKVPVLAYNSKAEWWDIGNVSHYFAVKEYFRKKTQK